MKTKYEINKRLKEFEVLAKKYPERADECFNPIIKQLKWVVE